MECTGIFASKEKASALIQAGARKVLISAPADNVDATIVYGVNHKTITKDMTVISNASCTTNCLAPVAKVLHETLRHPARLHGDHPRLHRRSEHGGHLAQGPAPRPRRRRLGHPDLDRRGASAVGLVLPELKGKLDGTAIRIPDAQRLADLAGREPAQGRGRHQGCR